VPIFLNTNTVLFRLMRMLRPESPSGKCAKLHTVAASNDRDHLTRSLYYCYYCLFAPHVCGCYSSCTCHSWWIAHSTQRQQRGCNKRQVNVDNNSGCVRQTRAPL